MEYARYGNKMWIKWTTCWSWGKSKWRWSEMEKECGYNPNKKDDILAFLENKEDPSWSDKFRGYKWTKHEDPPKEVIESKIRNLKASIKHAKNKVKELEKIMECARSHGK